MAFTPEKIEEVRNRADIVEIIGAQVRLKRTGRNLVGLCPFHNEKTPSFSVNPERGFFHCFGCGVGGTVFNFVMRIEGVSFPEAVRSLARRYGVTIQEREAGGAGQGERDAMYRANQVAAEFFAHVLWNTPDGAQAREYVASRGVAAETARAFMLGFAPARPSSLGKALVKRGLVGAACKVGLVKEGPEPYDLFRARLMFPIRDAQGRVIAFGGRVLDDRLPKYINSPESPLYSKSRSIYGLYEARRAIAHADRVIVVEGYLDAIAVSQAGFGEVVASLGTALTVEQLRLLSRYTRNVIACFDGDEAGRKASMRALEVFLGAGLLGRGIFIPAGFDPDTLIRKRGAQAFGELIDSAELLADYFLRAQAAAAGTLEEKARAAERVAETLRMVANPFEFDLLARKAASMLGVGEEVLRRQARRRAAGPSGRPVQRDKQPAAAPRIGPTAEAEVGLIAIALAQPELREAIVEQNVTANFADAELASLLGQICSSDKTRGEIEDWIAERLDEDYRSRLAALLVGDVIDDPKKASEMLADFVKALGRRRLAREVEQLKRTVAAASDVDEGAAAAQAVIETIRGVTRSDS
jgi:DNA primase